MTSRDHAPDLTLPAPEPEERPARGYGTVTVVDGPDGPRFEGPVPDRIGVEPDLLASMAPELGEYRHGGYLRILDVEFRQVGWDGFTHVFERVRA